MGLFLSEQILASMRLGAMPTAGGGRRGRRGRRDSRLMSRPGRNACPLGVATEVAELGPHWMPASPPEQVRLVSACTRCRMSAATSSPPTPCCAQ